MEINKMYLFFAILSTYSFIHSLIICAINANKNQYFQDRASWFRWLLCILASLGWVLAFN